MISLGIIGCGRVVQGRYIDVFTNELNEYKVLLACDIDRRKADNTAAQLKAKPCYSIEELIRSRRINTAIVATESGNHYSHAKKLLNAGIHVVVEKPPTMQIEQLNELEKIAEEKKLMFAPIFQNRLNPAMKVLKEAVDKNRFGKIVTASIRLRWCRYQEYYEDGWHGTWAMDGGVISQQAIHHVDALQWICGGISTVCAGQNNILNELEAEDTTVAIVTLRNGGLGVIEVTTAARPKDFEASISIVGEKGMAEIGGIALNQIKTWYFTDPDPEDSEIPEKFSQMVPTGYGLSHGPLFKQILQRIESGNVKPPFSCESVRPTLQLIHAIYSSVEKKGWVNISENPISARLGIN